MKKGPAHLGFAQAGDVFARSARPPRPRPPLTPNEAGAAFARPKQERAKAPFRDRPREAGSVFARRLSKPAPPVFKASTDRTD